MAWGGSVAPRHGAAARPGGPGGGPSLPGQTARRLTAGGVPEPFGGSWADAGAVVEWDVPVESAFVPIVAEARPAPRWRRAFGG